MRKTVFAADSFYHLYNRGNSKQLIFKDAEDYEHFRKLLYICNGKNNFKFRDSIIEQGIHAYDFDRGEPLVDIGAWVLMPNHFHLLVHVPTLPMCGKDGKITALSEFMKKLTLSYAKYFNEKYSRTGSLFEGRFKAEYAEGDNYLKYLFSYIHLNPIKLTQKDWKESGLKNLTGAFKFLENYAHSSFHEWLRNKSRREKCIINKEILKTVVGALDHPKKELLFWLQYK